MVTLEKKCTKLIRSKLELPNDPELLQIVRAMTKNSELQPIYKKNQIPSLLSDTQLLDRSEFDLSDPLESLSVRNPILYENVNKMAPVGIQSRGTERGVNFS